MDIIHRYTKTVMFSSPATTFKETMDEAVKSSADLQGADLQGANLGALRILDAGLRSDGFRFYYTDFPEEGPRIKAGCRNFTPAQAREHWTMTRGGTPLGVETFLILDHIDKLRAVRGWNTEEHQGNHLEK